MTAFDIWEGVVLRMKRNGVEEKGRPDLSLGNGSHDQVCVWRAGVLQLGEQRDECTVEKDI